MVIAATPKAVIFAKSRRDYIETIKSFYLQSSKGFNITRSTTKLTFFKV